MHLYAPSINGLRSVYFFQTTVAALGVNFMSLTEVVTQIDAYTTPPEVLIKVVRISIDIRGPVVAETFEDVISV